MVYLYRMNKRAPASSHLTNYLVDLYCLARLTHSFWAVAQFQRHEYYLTMSIRSEHFYRFSGCPEIGTAMKPTHIMGHVQQIDKKKTKKTRHYAKVLF